MRAALLVVGVAAAALGCGGESERPARAARTSRVEVRAGWTIRTSPPIHARELGTPRLALRPGGGGLVAVQGQAWGYGDCTRRDTTGAFVARFPGAGEIGAPVALHADLQAGPIVAGRRFAALLAEPLAHTSDCAPGARLVLADLTGRGHVSARRTLVARTDQVWQAAMAASPDGDLAVAWIEVADETTFRLRAVLRSRTGRLTRPVVLAQGDGVAPQVPAVDGVDVALSPEGAALVAYAEPGAVRLVTLRPDGTVARRRMLGKAYDSTSVAVAAGPGGRAAVAWGTQDGGEERNVPYVVRATAKARGARDFAPARAVDPGGAIADPPGGLGLALSAGGRALLVWDQVTSEDHTAVRYAQAPADGSFGRGVALRDGAQLAGFAVKPDGTAIVAMTEGDSLELRRRSATGTSFTPIAPPTLDRVGYSDVVYDAGGKLLVAWSRGSGRGTPVMRVARYD